MKPFVERFAAMPENDLYRLAEDVKNLSDEAREALRAEFLRRHLSVKRVNWKAQPPRLDARKPIHVGDADGEYTEMQRGKYHAWLYVGLGFALQVAILSFVFVKALEYLLGVASSTADFVGVNLAAVVAVLVYWNRWHCIEAYSSRHCSGWINLSLFYVPLIAFCYANYRGFLKLQRR